MWGTLAKLGGLVLTTIGLDYAVDSYKEKSAAEAQDAKEANIGKYVVLAAALFFGYKLLTRK